VIQASDTTRGPSNSDCQLQCCRQFRGERGCDFFLGIFQYEKYPDTSKEDLLTHTALVLWAIWESLKLTVNEVLTGAY